MPSDEIFKNPTVKKVIFYIKFSSIFYIESKIADLQMRLIDQFPESYIIYQKKTISNFGETLKYDSAEANSDDRLINKVWQLDSTKDYKLEISNDYLEITSGLHKSYKNPNAPYRFKEAICFITDNFLELTKLTKITRIGLNYIDQCPVFNTTNNEFIKYYNTRLPLNVFEINDSERLELRSLVKRGQYNLKCIESLKKYSDKYQLVIDMEAFAKNINSTDYLKTTDDLHDLVADEYWRIIQEPVKEYMRRDP